jgi:hypothetical protein
MQRVQGVVFHLVRGSSERIFPLFDQWPDDAAVAVSSCEHEVIFDTCIARVMSISRRFTVAAIDAAHGHQCEAHSLVSCSVTMIVLIPTSFEQTVSRS